MDARQSCGGSCGHGPIHHSAFALHPFACAPLLALERVPTTEKEIPGERHGAGFVESWGLRRGLQRPIAEVAPSAMEYVMANR